MNDSGNGLSTPQKRAIISRTEASIYESANTYVAEKVYSKSHKFKILVTVSRTNITFTFKFIR